MIVFGGTERPQVARLVLIGKPLEPVDRDSKQRVRFMDPLRRFEMATALAVAIRSLSWRTHLMRLPRLEHPEPKLGLCVGSRGGTPGTPFLSSGPVDQAGHVASSETVVDVHHGHVAGAAVEHPQQGRQAMKARAVADAGGDADYRAGNQASHSAR